MVERRTRRAATKPVNYAAEQEFSDGEDVFEDSPEEEPVQVKKTRRPRKSKLVQVELDEEEEEEIFRPSKPLYVEKGYDPSLPPIRERFPFLPEYEADGSPKIDQIVGRRPIGEKDAKSLDDEDNIKGSDDTNDGEDNGSDEEDETPVKGRGRGRGRKSQANKASPKQKKKSDQGLVEYEYLIKYKGRSYLHLEWKSGADLESMNKSAKTIYRRYLKKVTLGNDEELEDPNFDPSYAEPQKVIDQAEQEVTVELSDKELLKWEKQREKEMATEGSDDDDSDNDENEKDKDDGDGDGTDKKDDMEVEKSSSSKDGEENDKPENNEGEDDMIDEWGDGEIDFTTLTLERLRKVVNKDGPYYPVVPNCNNPYRDGYVTEPPKKPRASYLFFQCAVRSYFQKKNELATQGELMTILGDKWRTMSEEEQAPFIQLANEEAMQYEKEKALMERAQRPNEMWQPQRRCLMVLERLEKDSFADIFLEPVDFDQFPDYGEIVDQPMDLSTIRKKLKAKKYQSPEQFARDMRKVWNNCKIYNRHGSAIWHVADYMSKQFERLYHAWVLEFRERYLRWAHPKARPWEHTCRVHDGKCGTRDDQMVLCDHCDAMYGFKCLTPPMKKLPKGIWHCPDCKPKIHSVKGVRMMSAIAEQAARKRAELGDTPKRKVKQTMYLVKWVGLGYEFCTWETKEDIGNSAVIANFNKLNNSYPDEPDMPLDVVEKHLASTKHISVQNAGGASCVPHLRAQLYAQTRAFQFSKFGIDIPDLLSKECGSRTKSCSIIATRDNAILQEVTACLSDLVERVVKDPERHITAASESLPPLMMGEYDTVIPITSKGLMMNVGEINGSVAFLGYRKFPDGSAGPSEVKQLVRNAGDKIIAVDGKSTVKKSFKDVINILRESGKNKFAVMRFIENRYSVCPGEIASVGNVGRYTIEELKKKFVEDRKRLIVKRKENMVVEELEDEQVAEESDGSADEASEDESEGSFEPDSDEEDMAVKLKIDDKPALPGVPSQAQTQAQATEISGIPKNPQSSITNDDKQRQLDPASKALAPSKNEAEMNTSTIVRPETTKSLAFRLLGVDVGYSSDEGGDEDCAYFIDGVDGTFCKEDDFVDSQDEKEKEQEAAERMKKKNSDKSEEEKKADEENTLPVRRTDFASLGERSKLSVAVGLSKSTPDTTDFDQFPLPSTKEIAAQKQKELEAQKRLEVIDEAEAAKAKQVKRSAVKIEQVNINTNEGVHVWANAETAAATLQINLNQLRQILRGEYDEDLGDELGGFKWRFAEAGAEVTAPGLAVDSKKKKKGREAWLEFRDKLYDPNDPHPYKNNNRLRDYQVEGVNWLASTFYRKHGCILADEMGLGKTVQIVTYIEHLFRVEKIRRPYLVVVPLSTVEHWRREFEGWTNMICCVYHDRQRVWRDVLREYEWYYEDRPHTAEYLKFDVLVTTYDTLIGDFDVISQIPFRAAIVDEAHRLRNQKGKLLECMKEISAKGTLHYGFQSRVLMTGTPLQNDLNELWTLLNFIEPIMFPDLEEFQHQFGNMANRTQVEALQQKISPFMLRRVKEDVAKDIPAKEETIIDVELTSIQKQYYRAIFEHNHAFLNMGSTRSNAPKLMNIQMELRKVCNHPCLLEGVEHREHERQFKGFTEKGAFEGKSPEEQLHMVNEQMYIMSSGKMVLLDKLLPKLRQEGHKILIFSQMVRMLDLISEYCEFRSFPFERLDGRVRGTDRQKSIDRFERDSNSFLFLLSTRAGGVGINLTAADICIIFDSDWNPQNDVQAQARCHRIGQTKDVRIYRLVTSRTFEQEMFDRASKKLGLEQAVLGTFGHDDDDDKPTNKEMEQLLKKGAYALIEDENDEIGREFCADDIDSILAKRTRTRVVEGTKTASWLNKQGMVVSKSKFTSDSKSAGLDMDDPLFWQKIMPDFVTPSIMLQKLNDLSDEIFGTTTVKKGRGRGRWKKKKEEDEPLPPPEVGQDGTPLVPTDANQDGATSKTTNGDQSEVKKVEADDINGHSPSDAKKGEDDDAAEDENDDDGDDDDEDEDDDTKYKLSRNNQRKVAKFMADLKSMMEGIFDEADDDSLSSEEKATAQKLLLTISVKEKLFNEEQRHFGRVMLKRLEGNRRRRCRTSDAPTPKRRPREERGRTEIREELLITSSKKPRRKRRTKAEMEADNEKKRLARNGSDDDVEVPDDGYKLHSDDEADWSDMGEDVYNSNKKKTGISRKEAKRRRQWAADDDAATAAGRAWPAFPRPMVNRVLKTVLSEAMKIDDSKGGIFSIPVPPEEFPEYYEQIKKPMDYGTMKVKLDRGEYRSVQAMQKDFILVMQNCLQFNAPDSEIVMEARRQALMRPTILRNAALKHDLFLAEDGSVIQLYDDDDNTRDDAAGTTKKRRRRRTKAEMEEARRKELEAKDTDAVKENSPRKKPKSKKVDGRDNEDEPTTPSRKKPRIKINMHEPGKGIGKTVKRKRSEDDADGTKDADEVNASVPLKKRTKGAGALKGSDRKARSTSDDEGAAASGELPPGVDAKDPNSIYLNPKKLKSERESLDNSFESARQNFIKRGPWKLPPTVEDAFREIAVATLIKMGKSDKYSVFADAVSDSEAPGYSDVVKNPIDMSIIRSKVEKDEYGSGSKAASTFHRDLLLMFDNCALYNDDDGEVIEEAARLFSLVPEVFATACVHAHKKRK